MSGLHAAGPAVDEPSLWTAYFKHAFQHRAPEFLQIDHAVMGFLASEAVLDALIHESREDPGALRTIHIEPDGRPLAGHFRMCVPLAVTFQLEDHSSSRIHLALKLRDPAAYLPWKVERHFDGPHDELQIGRRIHDAHLERHFARTLAIGEILDERGEVRSEVELETFAAGLPLTTYFRKHLDVGCAAAARALRAMQLGWEQVQFYSRRDGAIVGLLFDSHADDIVVGGIRPDTAVPVFIDSHAGQHSGGTQALLTNAARLLVDVFRQVPAEGRAPLTAHLSHDVIEETLCRPLAERHGVEAPWRALRGALHAELSAQGMLGTTLPWS